MISRISCVYLYKVMEIIITEICVQKEGRVSRSWIKQLNRTGHHHPSFLPPLYSSQFFCPFYFHFTHFPQKWINARKNASTPRTGGSLFSGIVEFRVSKPGETARALRFIILFFDALFLSRSSCLSVVFVIPATTGRYPSSSTFAHCKTAFFPFRMVFTEDLGNCSLAVRITSASNTGPADGFVRWAFNETPGDPAELPAILLLPIFSFSSFYRPFPVSRNSCGLLLCQLALRIHMYASLSMADHVRIVHGITYDFARHFVFHPSCGIGVFRPTIAFFPSRVIFPVHFPVYCARCFW